MSAAALLVAGCGGGKKDVTPGNPSNNTAVCAYTKRAGSGGHVYCGYTKSGSSYTFTFGVFASSRTTGLAFCRSFPPAQGFKRDV